MSKTTDNAKNCLFFWGQASRDAETLGIANIALSVGGTARMVEGLLDEIDRLRDELSVGSSADRQSITLTDDERETINNAISVAEFHDDQWNAEVLRGLLARCALSTTSGDEVK